MSGFKLLQTPAALSTAECLEVIDKLRADVEAGKVAAFACASIDKGDNVSAWMGETVPVTRLRTMGALGYMLACMHSGEV